MKGIKLFISGLTFTRGNDQPFRSNAIAFLFSLRADIQTWILENTVEWTSLLVFIVLAH